MHVRRGRGLATVALLMTTIAGGAAPAAQGAEDPRYALAGGCFAVQDPASQRFLTRDGDGYRATAASAADAERFHVQATALGRALLFGRGGVFVTLGGTGVGAPTTPSPAADFTFTTSDGPLFALRTQEGRGLAVGEGGTLGTGQATPLRFVAGEGCERYPDIDPGVRGTPSKGATPYSEVRGTIDAHIHGMAFEFLGGRAHCGRPWHPYGVAYALVDCPDHQADGATAALENVISHGNPVGFHDRDGWPSFKGWPTHDSLTHEQTYFRWLERAWRGGLRVWVNLLVENQVLCELYPLKKNSCNEMDAVRLQAKRIRELEDYIDAQSGGPGKGWFRVVTDPFEARRVMNQGKLAVVLGIEVSKLFDCGVVNDVPRCSREQIDKALDEVHAMGVRQMELVNKFDNALAGVAGDGGVTGVAVNLANKLDTGRFWQMQTCTGSPTDHDREQTTLPGAVRDELAGNVLMTFLPAGALPAYPAPPHCNVRGLTDLGSHLVRRMIGRGMLVDPDHLSVEARNDLLDIVDAERYQGILSSHSWSTDDAYRRIYRRGGFITPYGGGSTGFVSQWRKLRAERPAGQLFGFGYGADMNGFGSQGAPRTGAAENPVTYPFRSPIDPAVTVEQHVAGTKTYDINRDGVAHYGLWPDWWEDLRKIAGDEIVEDMARGAEAYLQTWERAVGVGSSERCRSARLRVTAGGLGTVRLGAPAEEVLRGAGQPRRRVGRLWTYCVTGRDVKTRGRLRVVLDRGGRSALVASTATRHRIGGVGRGSRASLIPRGARPTAIAGVLRRPAGGGRSFLYGVRGGTVRWVAVASPSASRSLRGALKLAGLIR